MSQREWADKDYYADLGVSKDASADEESWRRYLYFRRNSNGWVDESWYHAAGCRRVISLRRNTTTNEIAPGGAE